MGRIRKYECRKCGEKYSTMTGIGMMYKVVQDRMLNEIREGRYGEEWKKLALRKDFNDVDAGQSVYICPECGKWKNEADGSLYFTGGVCEKRIRICECGHEMERDSSVKLCCPGCGTLNDFKDEYNWD